MSALLALRLGTLAAMMFWIALLGWRGAIIAGILGTIGMFYSLAAREHAERMVHVLFIAITLIVAVTVFGGHSA